MSAPGSAAAAPVARAAKVAPALRGDLMWTPIMLATAHAAVLASAYAPLSAAFLARATEGRVLLSLPLTIVAVVGYMLAVGAALLWAPRPAAAAADGKQPPREAPREPEGTREAMFVYNVYMTLLSAVMFGTILFEYVRTDSWYWTQPRLKGPDGVLLAYMLWVNYISKPTEFLDTYFMVVKGNYRQISYLHVSHHAIMPIIMYILIDLYPGGNSCFGPMINSFVHTIMYGYYCLTGLGVTANFVKPLITTVQMTQFVVLAAQSTYAIADGYRYWPATIAWVSTALMVQMLVLFGNFAMQAYCPRKGRGAGGGGAKDD